MRLGVEQEAKLWGVEPAGLPSVAGQGTVWWLQDFVGWVWGGPFKIWIFIQKIFKLVKALSGPI